MIKCKLGSTTNHKMVKNNLRQQALNIKKKSDGKLKEYYGNYWTYVEEKIDGEI